VQRSSFNFAVWMASPPTGNAATCQPPGFLRDVWKAKCNKACKAPGNYFSCAHVQVWLGPLGSSWHQWEFLHLPAGTLSSALPSEDSACQQAHCLLLCPLRTVAHSLFYRRGGWKRAFHLGAEQAPDALGQIKECSILLNSANLRALCQLQGCGYD
jgi:hypothetical protein